MVRLERGRACADVYDSGPLAKALGNPALSVERWIDHAAPAFLPDEEDSAAAAAPQQVPADKVGVAVLECESALNVAEDEEAGESSGAGEAGEVVERSGVGGVAESDEDDWQPAGGMRPRQPTLLVKSQMDELWQEIDSLEGEGKFTEAAEKSAARLVEIKHMYDQAALHARLAHAHATAHVCPHHPT